MADEPQYSSDTNNNSTTTTGSKRKYDDHQTTPPSSGRTRPTGFSSGPISSPDSHAPPPSYNSVPLPDDEISIAKQKVQAIASRLMGGAPPPVGGALDAKRLRVENGSGGDYDSEKGFSSTGFSSAPPSDMKPLSAVAGSYGSFQGTSKRIEIPNNRVGVIIGKGGETIKYLQLQSGSKIQVTRDNDADPHSVNRPVEIMGTPDQIAKAEQLINEVLSEADAGGSGIVNRRLTTGGQGGSDHFSMRVPNNKVGLVIGKGGETIKSIQMRSGARVQVIPLHPPPGDTSQERTVQIDGTSEQIETAKQMVNEVISENRLRNSGMSGGYPQQGYQARPPSNWGPGGAPQMTQSGYGYMQPGSYPGPSPHYNTSQPPYGGYPQQPASGGYASGWDQSGSQPTSQGGGYDYYGQQSSSQQQTAGGPTGAADNSGYNYAQPPASGYSQQGQAYSHDGYGGYHSQSGYGQPPYDQQGYGSAPSYGAGTNPPQEGHTASYGAQGESAQAPPSAQSGYGTGQQPSPNTGSYPQGTSQSGYGVPPTSQAGYQAAAQQGYGASGYGQPQGQKPSANPPAYGQNQQSPSNPGGYGQTGYSHSQPPASGYAQPDSGSQRAPPAYGATAPQSGYPPSYGASAPGSQPGYGQPPPYSGSYGSGYQQPAAYSADGNSSGSARGSYDAPPASQSGQQSGGGVAKASPQS